jgi:hypothetical protein
MVHPPVRGKVRERREGRVEKREGGRKEEEGGGGKEGEGRGKQGMTLLASLIKRLLSMVRPVRGRMRTRIREREGERRREEGGNPFFQDLEVAMEYLR